MIAANKNGPGLLAYKREYKGRTVLVMFNTSRDNILVTGMKASNKSATLRALYGDVSGVTLDASGYLTTKFPGRSIVIAELENNDENVEKVYNKIVINNSKPDQTITEDIVLSGRSSYPNSKLLLIKNTYLKSAREISTDQKGNWQITYPVNNLGQEQVSLMVYHSKTNTASDAFTFSTFVEQPERTFTFSDPIGDDIGLNSKLSPPTHNQSIGQQDIIAAKAEIGGEVLNLTLTMKELTNDWLPTNGFDNVAFSLFFNFAGKKGAKILPMINAEMPYDWTWDLGHVIYGWGNTTFSAQNANMHHQGKKFGIAPLVTVDKSLKTITFSYRASDFGVTSWLNSHIYVTTWDITGEGAHIAI